MMKNIDTNKIMESLEKKKVVMIAARPSTGKTQFLCKMASSLSLERHATSLIISLEESKDTLQKLFFDKDYTIQDSNLLIDDAPGSSVEEIKNKLQSIMLERNVEYLMIDGLQLLSASKAFNSRTEEIKDILKSLQQLAEELDICIIITSQLGKTMDQNIDKYPTSRDLSAVGIDLKNIDTVFYISDEGIYTE